MKRYFFQMALLSCVVVACVYDDPSTAQESLWMSVNKDMEYVVPELPTSVRIYSLPVVAGKAFTIFGEGFRKNDVIEMTSAGFRHVDTSMSFNERGVSLQLPDDIVSGQYLFMLIRDGEQQPLGKATLTVVETMPTSAEVIAHRGHWNVDGAAQNSRASLQNALDMEVYGSETDVWATLDNHLMINHDRSLEGITICESDYGQCSGLLLGNGENMPELHEFIEMVRNSRSPTKLVIEVKDHGPKVHDIRASELVLQAVADAGMTGSDKIEYISFSRSACERIISLDPEAKVAFLSSNASTVMRPVQLHELGYSGLDYEMTLLRNNPDWIDQAHELGMTVNVWTVDNVSDMVDFTNMGVDFITTNDPETALDIKWHYDNSAK